MQAYSQLKRLKHTDNLNGLENDFLFEDICFKPNKPALLFDTDFITKEPQSYQLTRDSESNEAEIWRLETELSDDGLELAAQASSDCCSTDIPSDSNEAPETQQLTKETEAGSEKKSAVIASSNTETDKRKTYTRSKKLPEGHTWQCSLCSKIFTKKYALDSHMARHSTERPFTCTVCPKQFKRSYEMRRHVKSCEVKNARLERVQALVAKARERRNK
jgi:hypothetical protein